MTINTIARCDFGPMLQTLRNAKRRWAGTSLVHALYVPSRAIRSWRTYIWPHVVTWMRWLIISRENANFTYRLTVRNRLHLAASLSALLGVPFREIEGYFNEIETDQDFAVHIQAGWDRNPMRYRSDRAPLIGRRIVWYAIARALKPRIIVETGVDQGIGSVVLCAALAKNRVENFPGRYFGIDLNPNAGHYLSDGYAVYGSVLYGDSIETLKKFNEPIDLFINDSDHSADYESAEYETIKDKLTSRAMVLGDNSHATTKLAEFSIREGRRFVFLAEEPDGHFYHGGGVGISLR